MAGQGGKKIKINYSSVHEEFDIVENYYHPTLEVFGEARKCKVCKFVIAGKSSTNLKSHLKALHFFCLNFKLNKFTRLACFLLFIQWYKVVYIR